MSRHSLALAMSTNPLGCSPCCGIKCDWLLYFPVFGTTTFPIIGCVACYMGAIQGSKESEIIVICFTGRIVDCWPGRISSSIFRLERCGAVGSRRTLDERAKWDTPSRVPERLRSQEGAGPTKPEVWVHETGEPLDQAGTVTGQTVDRQTLACAFQSGYHRQID